MSRLPALSRASGGLTGAMAAQPAIVLPEAAGTRPASHALLATVILFLGLFLVWAGRAPLDEVTHAEGTVIPSRQLQLVQNQEGGLLAELLVHDGDVVAAGQVLARIDNVRVAGEHREAMARALGLRASLARLRAEIDDVPLVFAAGVATEAPETVAHERELHASRRTALDAELQVLRAQMAQRADDLAALRAKAAQLARSSVLAEEQLRLARPLAAQKILARTVFLEQERAFNDLAGELTQTRLALPRAESALAEARERIAATSAKFRSEALADAAAREGELASLTEVLAATADKVDRSEVRSPVRGTVKRIMVTTIGGVVQPGQDLIEIVPLDDRLVVEARLRPADIAFVRPGQAAAVKLSAYDFSIYGGLAGRVEEISADTIADERGATFYRVRVVTDDAHLSSGGSVLRVIPGMTAQVDILTGRKTVLDYLLKPIFKARERALRER